MVSILQELGMEVINENMKHYAGEPQYITWVNFERDILFMHKDIFQMSDASNPSLLQRIGKLYRHQLTLVKKLAISVPNAENLVYCHSQFWQTLIVLCPKLTEVTIFTNGCSFSDPHYDFSTASRDSRRITKKTMDEALKYFYLLKSSLITRGTLSYEVEFAHLQLDEMPEKLSVPKPKPQELELKVEEEIVDKKLLSRWICD
ncbi:hypothetical protein EAF04_002117 [Stromatinia cepivora]|nr:hypothetical protein EAF04_002117 [Stromatinia cepivora]